MWLLAALCVLFWTLVLERLWYTKRQFPQWSKQRRADWQQLCAEAGQNSRYRQAIRAAWLAQAREQLLTPLSVTRTLVAMFPLLGLLGTVTGMVAVFEVLAVSGSGNPRAMAGGVGRRHCRHWPAWS